jgi:hypothetical protein
MTITRDKPPARRRRHQPMKSPIHALIDRHKVNRLFYERLSEPLHLNILSLFVAAFGSFRRKVEFDLVVRHSHAFSLLQAADNARLLGLKSVTAIEFGVANGAGLLNICKIAHRVTRETGIAFRIAGFDTGAGLPPPRDYRDHPEYYCDGDYPMNHDALRQLLPPNAELLLGNLQDTVPTFVERLTDESPIGFVSIDVDYYWSTKDALRIFAGRPENYLPTTTVYLDDVTAEGTNPWCGELLAINEFNDENELRKICQFNFLRNNRLFKNANWIDHIFTLHVFDHRMRGVAHGSREINYLSNPYFAKK